MQQFGADVKTTCQSPLPVERSPQSNVTGCDFRTCSAVAAFECSVTLSASALLAAALLFLAEVVAEDECQQRAEDGGEEFTQTVQYRDQSIREALRFFWLAGNEHDNGDGHQHERDRAGERRHDDARNPRRTFGLRLLRIPSLAGGRIAAERGGFSRTR